MTAASTLHRFDVSNRATGTRFGVSTDAGPVGMRSSADREFFATADETARDEAILAAKSRSGAELRVLMSEPTAEEKKKAVAAAHELIRLPSMISAAAAEEEEDGARLFSPADPLRRDAAQVTLLTRELAEKLKDLVATAEIETNGVAFDGNIWNGRSVSRGWSFLHFDTNGPQVRWSACFHASTDCYFVY